VSIKPSHFVSERSLGLDRVLGVLQTKHPVTELERVFVSTATSKKAATSEATDEAVADTPQKKTTRTKKTASAKSTTTNSEGAGAKTTKTAAKATTTKKRATKSTTKAAAAKASSSAEDGASDAAETETKPKRTRKTATATKAKAAPKRGRKKKSDDEFDLDLDPDAIDGEPLESEADEEADIGDVVRDEGQHPPGHRHRHAQDPQRDDVQNRDDEAEDGGDQPVGAHRPGEARQRRGDLRLEDRQGPGAQLDAGHVEHEEDDGERHDHEDRPEGCHLGEHPLGQGHDPGGVEHPGGLAHERGLVDPEAAQQRLELRPDGLEFPAVAREGLDELGDRHAQGHEQADDEGVDEDDGPDGGDGPGHVVARGQGHDRAHGDDECQGEERRADQGAREVDPGAAHGQAGDDDHDGLALEPLGGCLPAFGGGRRGVAHARILPRSSRAEPQEAGEPREDRDRERGAGRSAGGRSGGGRVARRRCRADSIIAAPFPVNGTSDPALQPPPDRVGLGNFHAATGSGPPAAPGRHSPPPARPPRRSGPPWRR